MLMHTNKNWAETLAQTITASPVQVLQLLILQKRENCNQAFEKHTYKEARGLYCGTYTINARLDSLLMEIQSSYIRTCGIEDYKALRFLCDSDDIILLRNAWDIISEFLDQKKITVFDTRNKIDTTNMELENAAKNL